MDLISIPINDIKVENRLRKELGDIDSLSDSIRQFGLVEPLVINQENRLVAGERRLRACQRLGMEKVDCVYRETLSADQLHEIEIEENVMRKQMTWQERCLAIAEIHDIRRRRGALAGWRWGQRETADMFSLQLGTVNYTLRVAEKLRSERDMPMEQRRYWHFQSCNEAWRLGIMADEQARIEAELAARQHAIAKPIIEQQKHEEQIKEDIQIIEAVAAQPDLLEEQRAQYYSNPLNPPGSFDAYWLERTERVDQSKRTVYVTSHVLNTDCIPFMSSPERSGVYDHIVTDIPYGIDLDYIDQQNPHAGMVDLDRMRATHDVEENMSLMARFFPAAFACTKESAFVVTFCDIMQWQYMYDLAVEAGFAVQRWPLIWVKPEAMNQCAGYNFTKNYEPVMVCRKPGAVLAQKTNTCVFSASQESARKETSSPFAKPYEMTRFIINAISHPGQTILDPFLGGGSIFIEIDRSGRRATGTEIDTPMYNSALENIKRYYRTTMPNPIFV